MEKQLNTYDFTARFDMKEHSGAYGTNLLEYRTIKATSEKNAIAEVKKMIRKMHFGTSIKNIEVYIELKQA